MHRPRLPLRTLAVTLLACASALAHASLLEDDDARRAIIDLRQRAATQHSDIERELDAMRRANEVTNTQLRRTVAELQAQIEAIRSELAQARGSEQELLRRVRQIEREREVPAAAAPQRPHGR